MSGSFKSKVSAASLIAKLRRDDHVPLSAMIEVADRCNETCVHCYQIQGQKGELPTDDWRAIIDQLADMGVLFLTISGGEATLRKDLFDLIAHARARRFAVKLYTNGLNMSAEMAQRLAQLAVQEVQISLYSVKPEVHDEITCVPRSWERTVDAARHLVEAGVKVVLKSPMMKMNVGEIDAYAEFVHGLGADFSLSPEVDPRENGDRSTEAYRMQDADYVAARRHPRLASPVTPDRGQRTGSVCGACSGNIHIEANGALHPCTSLQVPVGHAVRDGVAAAWHHNEVAAGIRGLTWDDLHGCSRCDLSGYCSRCFSTARTEVGDALAPYASACRAARLDYEAAEGVAPVIVDETRETGPYQRTDAHRYSERELGPRPVHTDPTLGWTRSDGLVQIRTSKNRPRPETVVDGH